MKDELPADYNSRNSRRARYMLQLFAVLAHLCSFLQPCTMVQVHERLSIVGGTLSEQSFHFDGGVQRPVDSSQVATVLAAVANNMHYMLHAI